MVMKFHYLNFCDFNFPLFFFPVTQNYLRRESWYYLEESIVVHTYTGCIAFLKSYYFSLCN